MGLRACGYPFPSLCTQCHTASVCVQYTVLYTYNPIYCIVGQLLPIEWPYSIANLGKLSIVSWFVLFPGLVCRWRVVRLAVPFGPGEGGGADREDFEGRDPLPPAPAHAVWAHCGACAAQRQLAAGKAATPNRFTRIKHRAVRLSKAIVARGDPLPPAPAQTVRVHGEARAAQRRLGSGKAATNLVNPRSTEPP